MPRFTKRRNIAALVILAAFILSGAWVNREMEQIFLSQIFETHSQITSAVSPAPTSTPPSLVASTTQAKQAAPSVCPEHATKEGIGCVCDTNYAKVGDQCVYYCPVYYHNATCVTSCPENTFSYSNQCYDSCAAHGLLVFGASCLAACPPHTSVANGVCVAVVSGSIVVPLSISPSYMRRGSTGTLSWDVSGMLDCGVSGSDGSVPAPDSQENGTNGVHRAIVSPQADVSYTLSCFDEPGGVYNSTLFVILH